MLEDDLYRHYVWIRNKARRIKSFEAFTYFFRNLPKSTQLDDAKIRKFEPWNLFLLMRWIVEESNEVTESRVHNEDLLNRLLNHTKGFQDQYLRIANRCDMVFFFKGLATQQFWHQEGPEGRDLLIQRFLFDDLDKGSRTRNLIVEKLGFEPNEISDFNIMLMVLFQDNVERHKFSEDWFAPVEKIYPKAMTTRFLDHLALDWPSLVEFVAKGKPSPRELALELVDYPLFIERPLFRHQGEYWIYSPALLLLALRTLMQRTVLDSGEDGPREEFQRRFERLVGNTILDAKLPVVGEPELLERFPGQKVVDFLIELEGCRIFIECKGVESSSSLKRATSPRALYNSTKSNIFKALVQGAHCLRNVEKELPRIGKKHLIVVSLGNLQVPFGDDILECSDQDRVVSLKKEVQNEERLLGFDSISIVSLREVLLLFEMHYFEKLDIKAALERVAVNNSDVRTKKANFQDHFQTDEFPQQLLPMYEAKKASIFNEILGALKASEEGVRKSGA